jgi:hypothetical protein
VKVCPNCQTKYPDDANFCPQETCATPEGPRRLDMVSEAATQERPQRYELDNRLGGSRSGDVWQARDGQTGKTVAYKRVVRAALPTPASLERAQRELKQLQRATSPRIAQVLDYGKDPEGQLFVVTELIEGRPLDAVVAETGAMPLDRAKKIVAQIGEALLEGQKVGVVHHDLSAKNVLVGAADEVKVINFVAPCPVSDTIFGVPEYLSPEQAEGKLVDQRSNTYSLGAILSLMLTGQPPAAGPDVASILEQVLRGEHAPPSQRAPGLTPEVDRVVGKAMEKSPNRRPLTMRQFLTDVAGLVGFGVAVPAGGGVGFAKTMMFTGGSPEVQRLVNQAIAARGEGNGSRAAGATPPLAPQPETGERTPPPQFATPAPGAAAQQPIGPRRTHGAAVAATVVAMPAATPRGVPASSGNTGAAAYDAPVQTTPPPVAVAPPPAATPAPTPKPAAGGTFRETLWFKKGDVDQMVADARARVEASRGKGAPPPAEAELPAEDARPIEERYVDDGSVTTEDRKKFSLRSGGTSSALPTVGGMIPGERMSDAEMAGEIGGGKRTLVFVIAGVVVLGLIVTVVMVFRGKNVAKGVGALTPVPVQTQPTPAPAPPPPAPAAAAPTPAKPAEGAEAAAKEDDGETPAAAAKPRASARKQAAKKDKTSAKAAARAHAKKKKGK